jgi:hypothetical protein
MGEKFEPAEDGSDYEIPGVNIAERLYGLECRMSAVDGNRVPMPARGSDGFQDYVHQELWDLDARVEKLSKNLGVAFLLISAVCWALILSRPGE